MGKLLALGYKQGGLGRYTAASKLLAVIVFSRLKTGIQLRFKTQGASQSGAQGLAIIEGWEKYSLGAVLSQPV